MSEAGGATTAPEAVPARVVESSLAPPVDEEIGLQVIERLAVGRSLNDIASVPGMPSKDVFLIWLIQSPALAQAYKHAQAVSAFAMEDEVLDMLRRLRDEGAVSQARVRSTQMLAEHLRWAAEKRNPAVYAKQATVAMQVPIQINTTLDMGGGGGGGTGTKEFPNIYEIKAVKHEVVALEEREPGEVVRTPRRAKPEKAKIEKEDTPEAIAAARAKRAEWARRWRAKVKAENDKHARA